MPNLTIVLPTYNEADNLARMVGALLALPLEHDVRIVVVDDNSPDGTGPIADDLRREHPCVVDVLHRPRKEGLGAAYLAGFRHALDGGADLVLQMDCDFSHRPEDVPALVEAAERADVVIGSRFCAGGSLGETWGRARRVLSRVANGLYVRWSLGLRLHDATGGFRVWRAQALREIDPWSRLTQNGFGFQVEMAYMASRLGLRIAEAPIHFPDRARGRSKMSGRIMAEAALNVPLLRDEHAGLGPPGRSRSPLRIATIRPRTQHRVLALVALALMVRLVAMAQMPLAPEEAYYWMYAQQPSLSYFDHPPMISWVIALGTALFGDTELGVRFVGQALMLASAWLMYRFGAAWFGRGAGLAAAVLLLVLPLYYATGFIATMDAPLLFFWMLGLVGVTGALRQGRPTGWYIAGAALGGAMLSKYTGVFLAVGAVGAVVAHAPWRWHLRSVHPYLAVLLAGAIFSPVVLWNASHGWASFRFQFLDRFADGTIGVETIAAFVGIQVLALTPVLLWRLVAETPRLVRHQRFRRPKWIVTASFALPLLAVMAVKSLRHDIHLNWTLPALLVLLPAASYLFLVRVRQARSTAQRLRWSRPLAWTAGGSALSMAGVLLVLVLTSSGVSPVSAFGPWSELAAIVEEYEEVLEHESGREPLIVGMDKYRLASVLAFYRGPMETFDDAAEHTSSQWLVDGPGLGYAFWSEPEDWIGYDCIVVADERAGDIVGRLRPVFGAVELVSDDRLSRLGRRHYQIAICRGYLPRDRAVAVR
jgi:dolichol-phosphate mannosyltransferase